MDSTLVTAGYAPGAGTDIALVVGLMITSGGAGFLVGILVCLMFAWKWKWTDESKN